MNFLRKHSKIISVVICDLVILTSIISMFFTGISVSTFLVGVLAFAVGLPRVVKLAGQYNLKDLFSKKEKTCSGQCENCTCEVNGEIPEEL
jgi:hypothetical protein